MLETAWGVTPGSPALAKLRMTGEGLKYNKETVESEEIRDDRQTAALVKVGSSSDGNISFELSYTQYQPFIASALFALPVVANITGLSADASLSGQTLTAAAASFNNVVVGGSYRIAGLTNPASNGIKRVVAKAGDGSVITLAAGSIAADQAGATISVKGTTVKNGVLASSYLVERKLPTDVGGFDYEQFLGLMADTLSLNFEAKKIVTGEIGFLGKTTTLSSVSIMDSTGTKATGTLTLVANPGNNETVVIAGKTYTYKTALTGGGATANEVLIGADASASLDNLVAAITGGAGSGVAYGSATVTHTLVTAAAGAGDTMVVTSLLTGTAANAYGTTETMANAGNVWGASTLTGGVTATAYTSAPTDSPVNATNNVTSINFVGISNTEKMRTMKVNIANNLRGKDCMGTEGFFGIGIGSCKITGSFEMFFSSNALLQSIKDHTAIGINYVVTDSASNAIVFNYPAVMTANGAANISAKDTDVMLPIDFEAILDPVTNAMMLVSWVPAS